MADTTQSIPHIYPIDRLMHATEGRLTAGISPSSALLAYLDWAVHLANSPGKQGALVQKALRKSVKFSAYAERLLAGRADCPCIEPLPQDHRFRDPAWQKPPFSLYYQSFLLAQQWWHNATEGVHGVTPHHQAAVAFAARQILDLFSPSNFPLTNPEVLQATLSQGGMNLVRGAQNFFEDWERTVLQRKPVGTEKFRVGKEVAITPGKVV